MKLICTFTLDRAQRLVSSIPHVTPKTDFSPLDFRFLCRRELIRNRFFLPRFCQTYIEMKLSSTSNLRCMATSKWCVAKWLTIQENKLLSIHGEAEAQYHFTSLVAEVMSHVRFPMMSPRQLASLLIHSLTSRFKDFFIERMALAMAFHNNQNDHRVLAVLQDKNGHLLFTPRLYTTEQWSASLIIENYPSLATYGVRTLVFNTPISFQDSHSDHFFEWTVDIYPKGVWFKKFYLIVWQGTLEIPESVSKTVRLSLTQKDPEDIARVSVGILICGKQDGLEHVRRVVQKNFVFSDEERMLNINDLVPYEDLNDLRAGRSAYLTGPNSDCLKLHVVITPLPTF
ncbi:hypothetical protein TNCV_2672401 [Trichonephila clavipes]|nr:hypothetical protein TNCV_2672401 [Trichonephila clavipes]